MNIDDRKTQLLALIEEKLKGYSPEKREALLLNVKDLAESSYLELERFYEDLETKVNV